MYENDPTPEEIAEFMKLKQAEREAATKKAIGGRPSKSQPVETKSYRTGRLDGISNRPRGTIGNT